MRQPRLWQSNWMLASHRAANAISQVEEGGVQVGPREET
jgi:hypothetical protein